MLLERAREDVAAIVLADEVEIVDVGWRERYASALACPGVAVQEPSYTDLEVLATLLQHVDCVVANAGTILLDSLVNAGTG